MNPKLRETLITKKYNINNRTNYANRLLAEEHGHPYKTHMTKQAKAIIDNFNGMTEDEMKDSAKMHKINVNIYKYDKDKRIYDIDAQWFFDNNYPTFSAVLYSTEDFFHVMYVSKAEILTKILICPKCKSHIVRNDNGHGVKRMQAHVDKCDGTFKKNYIAEKVSLPYCPTFLIIQCMNIVWLMVFNGNLYNIT